MKWAADGSRFRESWHIPESPVEDKAKYRDIIEQDTKEYLIRGGTIEPGISVQLRCVKPETSHSETRVVYVKDGGRSGQDASRAELSATLNRYGRVYAPHNRGIKTGLKS